MMTYAIAFMIILVFFRILAAAIELDLKNYTFAALVLGALDFAFLFWSVVVLVQSK